MSYLDAADRLWPVLGRLMQGHVVLYRATGGLVGHRVPFAPPMLLLDHVGAKSGRRRTTPLVYIADGEDVVVVASKGGHPRHPGWFHNLRASPETTVQVGSRRRAVHARVATAEERSRLWPKAVRAYGGYRGYQQRTDREIPLVILEPATRLSRRPRRHSAAAGSRSQTMACPGTGARSAGQPLRIGGRVAGARPP